MADLYQVELLNKGVKSWNDWRDKNRNVKVDLSGADFRDTNLSNVNFDSAILTHVNLSKACLKYANFGNADLSNANLEYAILTKAYLKDANLNYANLAHVDLSEAILVKASLVHANLKLANLTKAFFTQAALLTTNLEQAILVKACLPGANLTSANLTGANLSEAILIGATLLSTKITDAIFDNCKVYGISVWDVEGEPASQENLTITHSDQPAITVDDLEVAQFIHLLLNNKKLKNIIDTITSKAVLILGRFTAERKVILDAMRDELRKQNFTPILFDFDKPKSKDLTGTFETLARMARFIIADLTDPSSIPHELAYIAKDLRTTPIQPIRLKGTEGYGMFTDLQNDSPHRVFKTYEYEDGETLIKGLAEIIRPANEKAEGFRMM